ncbi:MAG: ribosomal protein S18-alanine N-acetyltransferase [Eubacteriales bacterium]|nr:ribosomal protein S18-alanine N-acetyltransferase [Eubacteriales bacterium]
MKNGDRQAELAPDMSELSWQIREMTESDLSQVCCIENVIFSQPWSRKGFLDSMNSMDTLYLSVYFDGKVVGYCGFLQSFEEADITNVAVDEAYRGRGIARSMLTELMHRGEQRGITAFTLEVRESNRAALHLYESLGFENCGIRKNFYEKPQENAVIMWRR